MKVCVLGASGRTGKIVVSKALEAGHDVVALVRDPAKLDLQDARLTVATGDVKDVDSLKSAFEGCDAVISTIGPGGKADAGVLTAAAGNTIAAMQETGARRLVFIAGAGVKQPGDPSNVVASVMVPVIRLFAKDLIDDGFNSVAAITASDLDYTVVRAPRLDDSPAQGNYKTGIIKPSFKPVSRADLADFCVQQLQSSDYLRQAPVISN